MMMILVEVWIRVLGRTEQMQTVDGRLQFAQMDRRVDDEDDNPSMGESEMDSIDETHCSNSVSIQRKPRKGLLGFSRFPEFCFCIKIRDALAWGATTATTK